MSIGENIKNLREQNSMTQAELGERIGVDRSAVAQYESGVKIPNMLAGKTIAEVLGISVEKLYE